MPYKRNRFIYSFSSYVIQRNGEKNSNFVLCTQKLFFCMQIFCGKCLFEYEFQFAIEKKTTKLLHHQNNVAIKSC